MKKILFIFVISISISCNRYVQKETSSYYPSIDDLERIGTFVNLFDPTEDSLIFVNGAFLFITRDSTGRKEKIFGTNISCYGDYSELYQLQSDDHEYLRIFFKLQARRTTACSRLLIIEDVSIKNSDGHNNWTYI